MPLMPGSRMPPPGGMPGGMPGAMPPGGAPQGKDAMQTMKENMSIFNPVDAAAMRESGEFNANMTVRDFFAKQGVDVDGPVTQLLKFVQDQAQKARPMNKMMAVAGKPPISGMAGKPTIPGMGGGQGPSAPPPDMGSLIQKLRG